MLIKAYYLSPITAKRNLPKVQFMWVEDKNYGDLFWDNGNIRKFGNEFFRTREGAIAGALKHMDMCLRATKTTHASIERGLLNQQRTLLDLENGIRLWEERGDLLDTAEPSALKWPWIKEIAKTISHLEERVATEKRQLAFLNQVFANFTAVLAKLTAELNRLKTFQQEVQYGL